MWTYALITYFAVGLIIILATPARQEIGSALTGKELVGAPDWKVWLFRSLVCTSVIILWPLFLEDYFRKKRSLWDDLKSNPTFKDQREIYNLLNELCEGGCVTDELPVSSGDFGYDITNPIPTRTVYGNTSYLAKLRLPDGTKVRYERQGSFSSPVSPDPVDGYEIFHPDGRQFAMLYLSPYQRRNSEKSPRGFELLIVTG